MVLTAEQNEIITEHLRNRTNQTCPMCANRQWTVESNLQYLGALDPEYQQPIEGAIFPVVTVVCNNCYLTLEFSAILLGIFSN